jgi:hypothetical protein
MPNMAKFRRLRREWHPTRNRGLTLEAAAAAGWKAKAWWQCSRDPAHQWRSHVHHRLYAGTGCPSCLRHRRSMAGAAPALRRQWHPTRNLPLAPANLPRTSRKRVWWRCPKDPRHEWAARVHQRVYFGSGCPYCSRRLLVPERSLAHVRPQIVAEWHPTRNAALTPAKVSAWSSRKVWWICGKGPDHLWEAQILTRTRGDGCPFCSGRRPSITNCVATRLPDVVPLWHPTKNGSLTPWNLTVGTSRKVWWRCPHGPDHEWQQAPGLEGMGTRRASCPYCANRKVSVTNSLASVAPQIAGEWHPTRNAPLTPQNVLFGTSKRVWWRCAFNHEWATRVNQRTARRNGCPVCRWLPSRTRPVLTRRQRERVLMPGDFT